MEILVNIKGQYDIAELATRYSAFAYFCDQSLQIKDQFIWTLSEEEVHDLAIFFYGKTGYGKSSTINRLVGSHIMDTHDYLPCTKKMNSVQYKITTAGEKKHLSFNDLPGVGESVITDDEYNNLYSSVLPKTACCVYVLRADQRDFSLDIPVFEKLFRQKQYNNRVIIAVNFSDKIEPITRFTSSSLSLEQQDNLHKKRETIQKTFQIPASNIVFYSADTGYNFTELTQKIATILKINCIV